MKPRKLQSKHRTAIFAAVSLLSVVVLFWAFPKNGTTAESFSGPVVTKSEDERLHDLIKMHPPVANSSCKNDCNFDKGWGRCDPSGSRCWCGPGHGDTDCSLHKGVFYGEHDLYEGLELRPLDTSGWDQGGNLYKYLVKQVKPNLVIEVGVWKGSSACKLSAALKEQGGGLFIGVDTWLPVKSFWENHKAENRLEDLHFVNGWPTLFYTFTGNLKHLGLQDYAIPFPASSRTASDFLVERGVVAELIHVDAAHYYVDVQEDLALWWRVLRPGGVMLGDDWSGAWPGVVRAVKEHAVKYKIKIMVYKNKWWVQKPLGDATKPVPKPAPKPAPTQATQATPQDDQNTQNTQETQDDRNAENTADVGEG